MAAIDPNTAWALFMSDPLDFVLMFAGVIVAVAWFVWWFRGYLDKERIATAEARLELARDEQKPLTRQIDTLTAQVVGLTKQIEQNVSLTQLAVATAGVTGTVKELTEANTVLGGTLGPSGGVVHSNYWLERAAQEWANRNKPKIR
jgi:hypothetical protein